MADGIKRKTSKQIVRDAIRKRERVPHLDEIVEYLVKQWGGPQKLAAAMYDIYIDEKTNSMVKGQILTKVLDLMKITSERMGGMDELDDLTEEELLTMLGMEASDDGPE